MYDRTHSANANWARISGIRTLWTNAVSGNSWTSRRAVATASSGKEGLELLASDRPSLVLCDLNMPEMDGLAVLEQVQRLDPDLPFRLP